MLTIRAESPEDRAAVGTVHRRAFPTDAEARLVDALRDAGKAVVSLVAELDGRVVGHVLFSPVTVEEGASAGLGLAPVAVLPEHQSRGVGTALIRAGLERCREAGYGFAVVLGHAAYYPRFGFRRASLSGLGNEYGADEHFMVLELRPDALTGARGLVRYAAEFGQLEG
jgi:putative acetyltransferase